MSTVTITARPAGPPRTAFVLADSAALGAMQAGTLRALYQRGIAPDLLAGTSAGALNAAFLASRPSGAGCGAPTSSRSARAWSGSGTTERPVAIEG